MIESQTNPPQISYDWKSFDRFHKPLHSFDEHMAKVIHSPLSDENPSLLNRVFSIVLSPVIYPLCGLSALMGIICHALGMSFVDEDQLAFCLGTADLKTLNEIIDLKVIKNEHIAHASLPIAKRCLYSDFDIAKILIDQIDTSKGLTTDLYKKIAQNGFIIRQCNNPSDKDKFDEIASLIDQKLKTSIVESTQCISIKKQIANDLKLWSAMVRLDAFQGENLQIFYGHKIKNTDNTDSLIAPFIVRKTSEGFDEFIKNIIIQPLQGMISNKYNNQSTVDIELLIVGELQTTEKDMLLEGKIVDYQSFRRSYVGNDWNGRSGCHNQDLKDSFMEHHVKYFKMLEIPAQIWNEDGSFKEVQSS
jgi:hypothetical protein